ncbi:GntR family transcriptional regulator [Crenobacter cavernae]|uniref:GntR family transcriptional regulator n=1 Tax=Crenobacter cavernae TaxID=2290923 RepID=A0ABY0FI92_9NEIS|nr:GntR family transcriptional regulator [Crenobacter cavernae]RXZ45341.1 GntR family transcriptional regulator [Crenobacter cavernae]
METQQKRQSLRTSGMSSLVTSQLREMIESGELPPGEKINEREFCEKFDISKTPLREALKVLVAEGLVSHRQFVGYRVTSIDLEELRSVFEMLHALEEFAGSLIASRIKPAELAEIEALHQRMLDYHDAGDKKNYFRTNQAIHAKLIDTAGNPVLASVYNNLMSKVYRARGTANIGQSRWDQSLGEHEEIIASLSGKSGTPLPNVMRRHSENTAKEVLEFLKKHNKAARVIQ